MAVLLAVAGLGALVNPVQADTIMVQPEGVVADLGANGLADTSRPVTNLINGTGLSDATLVQTGAPIPGTLPTHDNVLNNMWRMQITGWSTNAGAFDVTLTFDLDLDNSHAYDITGVYLWNYSESGNLTGRGLNKVVIQSSTDGVNYTQVGSGDFDFARAATTATYAPQYVDFGTRLTGVSSIRFVMQGADSNDTDARWLGAGEVRFTAYSKKGTLISFH